MTRSPTTPPKGPAAPSPASVPLFSGGGGSSTVIPIMENGRMRNLVVPPGGFIGFGSQTPATQAMFQRAGRVGGLASARKRRRKTAKKTAAKRKSTRRRKTAAKRRPARLVKGSAAAKRYMASIRRKRKR